MTLILIANTFRECTLYVGHLKPFESIMPCNPIATPWVKYYYYSPLADERFQNLPNVIAQVDIKSLLKHLKALDTKYLISISSRSKSARRFHKSLQDPIRAWLSPYRNNLSLSVALSGWEYFQDIVCRVVIKHLSMAPECNGVNPSVTKSREYR